MNAPVAEVLLHGYSAGSPQGSPGLGSVHLVGAVRQDGTPMRVLFDCGHAGRRRALLLALEERGLTPGDIDVLVLSHGHWDHAQNADLFTAARVLLHPAEARYLAAPPAADLAAPPWARAVLDGLDVRETGDGDEVASGVRVLELPGHTPGSVGLAVTGAAGTTVLTGDAVPTAAALRDERITAVFGAPRDAAASLDRVRALADVVHPGHDRPFRIAPDGALRHLEPAMPAFVLRVADPGAWRAAVRIEGRDQGVCGVVIS